MLTQWVVMVLNCNVLCHLQQCKCPDQDLRAPLYYNRSQNPAKPKHIIVRGSSKLKGYEPHLHACLPGTNYSPYLADAIITLFYFSWNYKCSVTNAGEEEFRICGSCSRCNSCAMT